MTDLLPGPLEEAMADGRPVLVLSAHLDDAVLSCGALLSTLARRTPVTVATVFSEAGPPPHTRAARAFLGQCTIGDAAELYAARQQEDVEVLAGLGVEHVHLGAPDALFRRREVPPPVARLGRAVPEVAHRYPTFRFDIARGRVSRGDRALVDRLGAQLRALAGRIDAAVVLGPVGVGRHVDHLLTRTLAERQPLPTVLYSDFPYDWRGAADVTDLGVGRLTAVTWDRDLDAKQVLIKGYRTQVAALFPDGVVPAVPETYFTAPGHEGGTPVPAPHRPVAARSPRPWARAGRTVPAGAEALVLGDLDLAVPLHAVGASVTMVGRPTRADRFSRYVSRWLDDPRPDEDTLVTALVAHAGGRQEPTTLFYQSDDDLLFVSRHRDELSPALRFVVPDADLVEKLVDKAAFQELAEQAGLPVPRGQVLDLARPVLDDRLTFPLVVKPLRREPCWDVRTAAKAAVVGDRGELDALVDELAAHHAQLILQQPVPGPETRMESHHVYVDSSGQVAAEFTGRKVRTHPMAMGHSTAVVTSDAPDVARLGREIVAALDLRGVAKLDFKRDADGRLWLLEVNPRFSLWHHVGAAAGVNIPAVVRADLLGLPRPPRSTARPEVAWCRVDRDYLAAREEGMHPVTWLRWVAAAGTTPPLDLTDPLPALAGALAPAYRRLRRSAPADRRR
ncbi:PIG-L family deacetylase [Geodermatophilus sp. DSM 45219]|uniref:PIG-L family deacetylase n=1 Tax=Geodermatophilus sp. DSM 45219 TaxID=1881103 RepID=UPI000880D6CB|nr:PIG-L family deacetylase [Geodermatophilus sp. DSM 45219]SDN54817.1 Predicted ATP-dependent carboligase, ATP-grasp superfamily [Geodermatophilus sp. DSM 45219]